jgi:hypothetical protein
LHKRWHDGMFDRLPSVRAAQANVVMPGYGYRPAKIGPIAAACVVVVIDHSVAGRSQVPEWRKIDVFHVFDER